MKMNSSNNICEELYFFIFSLINLGGDLKRKRKIKNDWTEKRGKLMPYTVALQLHTYWWCCWLEAWEIIFPNVLRGIRNTRLWTFTVSKQTSKKPRLYILFTLLFDLSLVWRNCVLSRRHVLGEYDTQHFVKKPTISIYIAQLANG